MFSIEFTLILLLTVASIVFFYLAAFPKEKMKLTKDFIWIKNHGEIPWNTIKEFKKETKTSGKIQKKLLTTTRKPAKT